MSQYFMCYIMYPMCQMCPEAELLGAAVPEELPRHRDQQESLPRLQVVQVHPSRYQAEAPWMQ